MGAEEHFSASYAEARDKFLEAARRRGLTLDAYPHPLPGRDGEAMALDVARFGPAKAERLLVVISGTHGVEGFCGSGAQVATLRDDAFWRQAEAAGVGVLLLHALNPYGFSHIRRVTHENVDLNRNFIDFANPPKNPAYADLHALLLPEFWPPTADNAAAITGWIAKRGERAMQAAVSGGQYDFPDGLFYGGRERTWSHRTIRQAIADHVAGARRLSMIDLHTGLGPRGHGERLYAGPPIAENLARARAWWATEKSPVVTLNSDQTVSAPLTGTMWTAFVEGAPDADITALAIEFGTQPLMSVLQALRGEQWLERNAAHAPPEQASALKRALRDAFYVDEPDWKAAVLAQASEAMRQAVEGLARQ